MITEGGGHVPSTKITKFYVFKYDNYILPTQLIIVDHIVYYIKSCEVLRRVNIGIDPMWEGMGLYLHLIN